MTSNRHRWQQQAQRTASLRSLLVAFAFFATSLFAQVDLGQVQVSTIGHDLSHDRTVYFIRDLLVDQRQISGGGAMLPSVSANFDLQNQFAITIAAPPGQRFLVQPPAGQSVRMGASLIWSAPPPYTFYQYGTVDLTFADFTGTPLNYFSANAVLTDAHEFFGFGDVQSLLFTTPISFSSVTLTATFPSSNIGRGLLDYTPSPDSTFVFFYTTPQPGDPGPFVSIIPEPPPTRLMLIILALLTVSILCRRRTTHFLVGTSRRRGVLCKPEKGLNMNSLEHRPGYFD